MSHQRPRRWIAEPSLDPEKVQTLVAWYEEALGDEDMAQGEEAYWAWAQRVAYESVLDLLHGQLVRPDPRTPLVRALVVLSNVIAFNDHGCEICGSTTDKHYEEDCFK